MNYWEINFQIRNFGVVTLSGRILFRLLLLSFYVIYDYVSWHQSLTIS